MAAKNGWHSYVKNTPLSPYVYTNVIIGLDAQQHTTYRSLTVTTVD